MKHFWEQQDLINNFDATSEKNTIQTTRQKINFTQQPRPADIEEHPQSIRSDKDSFEQRAKIVCFQDESNLSSPQSKLSSRLILQNLSKHFRKDITKSFITKLKVASNTLKIKNINIRERNIVDALLRNNLIGQENINPKFSLPVIESSNILLMIFDFIHLLNLIFSAFWLPYEICFQLQVNFVYQILNIIVLTLIVIDILLSFNRTIIFRGVLMKKRTQIFEYQSKKKLPLSIVQIFCLILKNFQLNHIVDAGLILLYLLSILPKIISQVDATINLMCLGEIVRDILSLMRMIGSLIHVVHVISCLWIIMGTSNYSSTNWISHYGFQDSSNVQTYLVSFYWAAMTMTTVGYGDITPKNSYEYAFANTVMLGACVLFGYTMNRIGALLTQINMRHSEFKQKKELFLKYIQKNKVTIDLQSQIESYLEYLQNAEHDRDQTVIQEIMSNLTERLRKELQLQLKGRFVMKCQSLRGFSQDFKEQLCESVKEVCVPVNEIISEGQKEEDASLYVIQEGQVEIKLQPSQQKVDELILYHGNTFGQLPFFTLLPGRNILQTRQQSILQRISIQDFLRIIKNFPTDREYFFYLKDQLTFNRNFRLINIFCLCCHSEYHLIETCPLLNLSISYESIIKKLLFPHIQSRMLFMRRTRLKCSSKKTQTTLSQSAARLVTYFTMNPPDLQKKLCYLFSSQTMSADDQSGFASDNKISSNDDFINPYETSQSYAPSGNVWKDFLPKDDSKSLKSINKQPTPKINPQTTQENIEEIPKHVNLTQFSCISDFDASYQFQRYYPAFNVNNVISNLNGKVNHQTKFSKYTFNFQMIKRFNKSRKRRTLLRLQSFIHHF